MSKRIVCLILVVLCLLPSLAFAKDYRVVKIIEGTLSLDGVILKSGDNIKGGSGLSVDVIFLDLKGNHLSESKGSIKSLKIDGEKVNEWIVSGQSSSYMNLMGLVRGAFEFTLKPAYGAPDDAGYYPLNAKTYNVYSENKNRKVALSGKTLEINEGIAYLSIADNMVVAVTTAEQVSLGDRLKVKGKISEMIEHNGQSIPKIECDEILVQKYETLKLNDQGESVLEMKKRLQELGYFKAGAELSDEYNDTCVDRVKQFQKKNGLATTGEANEETLALLFSDEAKSK